MTTAALAYAGAGWFVCPVLRSNSKHAGSVLGKGWPEKTTRDVAKLREGFEHPKYAGRIGVALHTGRSGVVAFDVDRPDAVPAVLRAVLLRENPPVQTSRREPDRHEGIVRGHYVFRVPTGVALGCSLGGLRSEPGWGEVKSGNSIIVAAPTPHMKPGGFYSWHGGPDIPELPRDLLDVLLSRPERNRAPVFFGTPDPITARNRLRAVLAFLAAAPEGERNRRLFWASARVGELGLDQNKALEVLTAAGEALGLNPDEIPGTIASGLWTGRSRA